MAYDRYIAVCEPLRYRLHTCCLALLCITVLFTLHINVPQHVYCSNRAIMNLACRPTPTNNIYGLSMSWTLSTGMFVIIASSYFRILHASVKRGRAGSRVCSKAFQTCASHLVVYVLYEISSTIIIVSHRTSLSQNIKKFISILFILIPPAINPIIYGLVSKELRASFFKNLFLVRLKKRLFLEIVS